MRTLNSVGIPHLLRSRDKATSRRLSGMQPEDIAKSVVLNYIEALDRQDYDAARGYLKDRLPVTGPGEGFDSADRFIEMLRTYRSKYDVKRIFADGDEACVLYDLATPAATVFMCSWYRVEGGKIASVRSVFDPRPFARPPPTGGR